jgi:DNA-binding beta-propeller fold protein YncE
MAPRECFKGLKATLGLTILLAILVIQSAAPSSGALATSPSARTVRGLHGGCGVGYRPSQPAFDNSSGTFYVPNNYSSNVTTFKANCQNVSSIALPTGSRPDGAAYDSADHDVYISDFALSRVYVLNGTALVATIKAHGIRHPLGTFYDAPARDILIPDLWGHHVSVIHGTRVVGEIATGFAPKSIAIDATANSLWIVDDQTSNITVVNNATDPLGAPHLSVSNGQVVQYVVHDSADGMEYVSNLAHAGSVSMFSSYGSLVTSIPVGFVPQQLGFSPHTSTVYVSMSMHSIWEIQGSNVTKKLGIYYALAPTFYVYDSWNDRMYVTLDGAFVRDSLFELPP